MFFIAGVAYGRGAATFPRRSTTAARTPKVCWRPHHHRQGALLPVRTHAGQHGRAARLLVLPPARHAGGEVAQLVLQRGARRVPGHPGGQAPVRTASCGPAHSRVCPPLPRARRARPPPVRRPCSPSRSRGRAPAPLPWTSRHRRRALGTMASAPWRRRRQRLLSTLSPRLGTSISL
jgi:hypothetical protein